MIKQMVVGFCYSGRCVWLLSALILFMEGQRSPELFQDLEDGYMKFKTPYQSVS